MNFLWIVLALSLGACATDSQRGPASVDEHASNAPKEAPAEGLERCYTKEIGPNMSVLRMLNAKGGSFSGSQESDRVYLTPWFGRATGPGSEVFEISKDSPAFFRAIQYVLGNRSDLNGTQNWQDYIYGSRMAAMLVAMMATADDAECTREFRRKAAAYLGPVAKELDELPLVQAADAAAKGDLDEKSAEVESKYRATLHDDKELSARLAAKEKENKAARDAAKKALQEKYKDLRADLSKEPACLKTLQLESQSIGTGQSDNPALAAAVAPCRAALEKRLEDLKEQESKLTPDSPDSKLKAVQEKVRVYQGYLEVLATPSNGLSLAEQVEELKEIVKAKNPTSFEQIFKSELEQRAQIQKRLADLAGPLLTYRYMSGKGSPLPSWAPLRRGGTPRLSPLPAFAPKRAMNESQRRDTKLSLGVRPGFLAPNPPTRKSR